jgi:hypothetical protein
MNMPEETILRPLNQSEKREMVELDGKKSSYEIEFKKIVDAKEQEFVKRHEPYCARCAKIDFYDNVSKFLSEKTRRGDTESLTTKEILNKCVPNLDSYGKPSHFDLLDESEVTEMKIQDGVRVPIITGSHKNYKCNVRGGPHTGGVSVFVPKGYVQSKK